MGRRVVFHQQYYRELDGRWAGATVNRTLCGRSSDADPDGSNVAIGKQAVTCKLCLKSYNQQWYYKMKIEGKIK